MMTNASAAPKSVVSLKARYRTRLLGVFAANLIVLTAAVLYGVIELEGIKAITNDWQSSWKGLGSAAGAVVIGTGIVVILSGLLSSDSKARIVFVRWSHPLPGCRAFSHYLRNDPRVDFPLLERVLGALPSEPSEQNRLWYRRIYAQVQTHPVVLQVHEDFLFSRDYAALSLLFLVFLGFIGVVEISSSKTAAIYVFALAAQFAAASVAARNYGVRLVTTSVAV